MKRITLGALFSLLGTTACVEGPTIDESEATADVGAVHGEKVFMGHLNTRIHQQSDARYALPLSGKTTISFTRDKEINRNNEATKITFVLSSLLTDETRPHLDGRTYDISPEFPFSYDLDLDDAEYELRVFREDGKTMTGNLSVISNDTFDPDLFCDGKDHYSACTMSNDTVVRCDNGTPAVEQCDATCMLFQDGYGCGR